MKLWNTFQNRYYPQLSDPYNSYMIVQQAEHAAVHNGQHFTLTYAVADLGAATTPDDTMTLSFTTPADVYCHMVIGCEASSGALFQFIEGKTGGGESPTGSLTPVQSFRPTAAIQTSGMYDLAGTPAVNSVSYDATVFTGGTTLHSEYIGSGQGPSATSGGSRGAQEIVLARDESYQLVLSDSSNVPGTIKLTWYEYDHRNYR